MSLGAWIAIGIGVGVALAASIGDIGYLFGAALAVAGYNCVNPRLEVRRCQ